MSHINKLYNTSSDLLEPTILWSLAPSEACQAQLRSNVSCPGYPLKLLSAEPRLRECLLDDKNPNCFRLCAVVPSFSQINHSLASSKPSFFSVTIIVALEVRTLVAIVLELLLRNYTLGVFVKLDIISF